ncbi:MAG: M48 family metallopeptidase [Planctomycetes bacterium]|nr:M48 family metallopeptidase [Planctomycetota bacterium]
MNNRKASVYFGKRKIDFFVKRSNRRRTVSLFVDPYEGVFLRAPMKPSLKTLAGLVHAKAVWILDKQRRINEILEHLTKREFVTGESFLYMGRQLRLKVLHSTRSGSIGNGNPEIIVREGRFLVKTNGHKDKAGETRDMLTRWYKKHAKIILQKRTDIYSEKLKIAAQGIILANQTKRWGSCNGKGQIRFNWRIIMAPMSLMDYVVAHELCHLKHIDHSDNFWRLLGNIMPDYENRRERLRKEGPKYYF